MPICGFPQPGKCFISLENWGGRQIGCAKLWLSEAWDILYFSGKVGSTDKLYQAVAFRSLENALFLKKTGGQQIGCANLWLSAVWKMLYFSGKGGGQQIDCAKMWLSEAWKMLHFSGKVGVNR